MSFIKSSKHLIYMHSILQTLLFSGIKTRTVHNEHEELHF
jgi:hypothetical protein